MKMTLAAAVRAENLIKAFKKRSKARRDITALASKLVVSVATAHRIVAKRAPWSALLAARRSRAVSREVPAIGTRKTAKKIATPLRTVQRDARGVIERMRKAKRKRIVARMVKPWEIESVARAALSQCSQNSRSRNICTYSTTTFRSDAIDSPHCLTLV